MKKVLGICITALATITLAGCQSKMSQSELKDSYVNVSNSVAKEINVITSYKKGNLSEIELNTQLNSSTEHAIKVSNTEIKKLDNNASDKKNTNKLITYAKDSKSFAKDLKNGSKNVNTSLGKVSSDSHSLKKSLDTSTPTKLKDAATKFNNLMAKQPHVSGNTAYLKNCTITITGTKLMKSDTNIPEIWINYSIKNTSKSLITPDNELVENSDITQENNSSVITLDGGMVTSVEQMNAYQNEYDLSDAADNEVKPGATVNLATNRQLDNTTYPVKLKFTNPDTGQSIGTIKLDVK